MEKISHMGRSIVVRLSQSNLGWDNRATRTAARNFRLDEARKGQRHFVVHTSSKRKRESHLRQNTLARASCLYSLGLQFKVALSTKDSSRCFHRRRPGRLRCVTGFPYSSGRR